MIERAAALMGTTVSALGFPDKLTALDEFPAWREVEPQALDWLAQGL